MNDTFAGWVYPTIRHVLDALKWDSGRGQSSMIDVDIPQLTRLLERGEAACHDRVDYELARLALECWIDETVEGRADAATVRGFRAASDDWEFFVESCRASDRDRADVLETFYLCTALGYRGGYRSNSARTGGSAKLPPRLVDWAKQAYRRIAPQPPNRFDPVAPVIAYDPETDARPLRGGRFFKRSLALLGAVGSLTAVLGGVWLWFTCR